MKLFSLATVVVLALAAPASADLINVYTVGSNPAAQAQDPSGAGIGGIPVINWVHTGVAGPATLTIVAEGIDTNEQDEVYFNGDFIGYLTNQGFQVGVFNLKPGPGALPGITALTSSVFNVMAIAGVNTVQVRVDTENWVNEIETSNLTPAVPEPATLSLLGFGTMMLAGRRLRRRSKA